jgi:hypothetical protein
MSVTRIFQTRTPLGRNFAMRFRRSRVSLPRTVLILSRKVEKRISHTKVL